MIIRNWRAGLRSKLDAAPSGSLLAHQLAQAAPCDEPSVLVGGPDSSSARISADTSSPRPQPRLLEQVRVLHP